LVILPGGRNNPSKVGPILQNQEISNKRADRPWSIEVVPINGPEDLREVTRGSDLEVTQLKPGKLRGSIKHIGIGNLGISVGQFSSEIRTRGPLHREEVVLGTLLASEGRSSHWWKETRPGDVGIFPPSVDADAIYEGGAAYAVVSIPLRELLLHLSSENRLADPAFWNTKRLSHPDPLIGNQMREQLKNVTSVIERSVATPSTHAVNFLQRSVIEALAVALLSALPQERERSLYTGARLVSETENYIEAADGRPVHISELCSALKVSRRSLHRAFADTLGIGPVAYLRRKRLSAIRSVLSQSDPVTTSIGDLAFEHGFPEPSRFAAYYRAHFGENPSDTSRSRSMGVPDAA
jgi:AraC family ethanolamine operon transcriptional activator